MISVHSFGKAYQDHIAVKNLDFTVQPGEVLGLVGRNGAGKTTTLKSIAGIVFPSHGSISVDGFDLDVSPLEIRQRTAWVADDPELFKDLTVEQHLLFTASVYGIANPHEEIGDWLHLFELESKRNTPASGLSRGMRQKLAICCAYLQRPTAILLDEPMTGLDPQAIRMLKQTIQQHAAGGAAVIISSHLLAMVEDVCSHVLILELGEKKFFGSIAELKLQFAANDGDPQRTLEEIYFASLNEPVLAACQ